MLIAGRAAFGTLALIALLVGFVAIAVLDLGAPGWLAAAAGAGCVAAGHFRLDQIKTAPAS